MGDTVVVKYVLGPILKELMTAVLDAGKRVAKFKPALDKLKTTLDAIKPLIEEIDQLYNQKDRAHEIEQLNKIMNNGVELVRNCLGLSWWKLISMWKYQDELTKLDESLRGFVSFDFTLQMGRNVLELQTRTCNQSFVFSCRPPKPPQFTVGLDVPLKELKMRLFNDASSVLVLSAAPGFGKTTLARKLCWDEEVIDIFKENIFFVTFSQNPKLSVIVGKLLQSGSELEQKFSSDEDAINQLESALQQMKKGPKLLVIDDVWSYSEILVKKFEFQLPDYKILVTSRFKLERFGTPFCLEPLHDQEAIALFRHAVSLDGSSYSYQLEENEAKIVKACGGCPFALEVIGGSLRLQSPETWDLMVRELSKVHYILESDENLLRYLLKSLDVLGGKVNLKECFADLGLFPEDQRIPVSALIDMWVELDELDEDGVTAMNYIWELSKCNLAKVAVTRKLPLNEGNYYSRYFVTQHDILRALAIRQSSQGAVEQRKRLAIDTSGEDVRKWLVEPNEQELAAQILSISTDEKTSSWYTIEPSKAEVLILNLWAEEYSLPEFMKKMSKLKVLIVTNYGYSLLELKNLELLSSLPNLKRIRLEQMSFPSYDAPLLLQNLRKLSLFMCNTTQGFGGIADISLVMPNLVEINIDYCNDIIKLPAKLFDSVHLQRLSITNCHKLTQLPEEIGKAQNLHILRLASCTDLEELPESIVDLDKLILLDISDCINVETLPEKIGKLCNLRTLCIAGCSKLIELPSTVEDLNLKDVVYDEHTSGLWERFKSVLTSVRIHERKVEISFD